MSKYSKVDEYLLGVLTDADAAQIEREAADNPRLRREIKTGRMLTALLAQLDEEGWSPRPAPPLRLDRVEKPERTAARAGRSWTLSMPRVGVAFASSVALIAIGAFGAIGLQRLGGQDEAGASVRLAAVGQLDPRAEGAVRLSADGSRATVSVSGLKPSGRNDYYEMWLMNSEKDLVSAGGFKVGADGRVKVEVPMPASMDDYEYFDISLESTGDTPGYSGRSVVRSAKTT